MAATSEDVLRALRPDEPRYAAAARQLGDSAGPVLIELVRGDNVEFAAKAASLAGFLTTGAARPVLELALGHADAMVRVAAAAALGRQPDLAGALSAQLLDDADIGVRKWTLLSLQTARPPGIRELVEHRAAAEQVPAIRELAHGVARQLPR